MSHMGYHRAPGMSSSLISLSHFLYRNPEDPAKTACLCWQPFNNMVVVSPRIFCHLAHRCFSAQLSRGKLNLCGTHWRFSVSTEMCLSALSDEGQSLCFCQFGNLCRCFSECRGDFSFLPVWEKDLKYQECRPLSDIFKSRDRRWAVVSPEQISIFVTWAENGLISKVYPGPFSRISQCLHSPHAEWVIA